jgi:putative hydrolase of the HAD superfamily
MRIKAVTFDLWFTLIYSTKELEEYYRKTRLDAIVKIFSRLNTNLSLIDAKNLILRANEEIKKRGKEVYSTHPKERVKIMAELLGLKRLDEDFLKWASRVFSDAGFDKPPYLNEEAIDTLNLVKSLGLKVGLITNVSRDEIAYKKLLRRLKILNYFDSLSFSSEIGHAKPDKNIFKHALKNLKLKPSEAVHIGDLYEHDILGAVNFGMRAILYTGLFKEREEARNEKQGKDFKNFIIEVSDLRDVIKIISKL